MTKTKCTTMVIIFGPDQRSDLENDLSIANSITSRLNGAYRPGPNSAICDFEKLTDCVRSAAALVDRLSRTEDGLDGVGIGIEEDGHIEAVSRLAERGLSDNTHSVFLTDDIYFQARDVAGVEYVKLVETVLPGRDSPNWVYGMSVRPQEPAAAEDVTLAEDDVGWNAEPEAGTTEPAFDMDETMLALDDLTAPPDEPAPSSTPALPDEPAPAPEPPPAPFAAPVDDTPAAASDVPAAADAPAAMAESVPTATAATAAAAPAMPADGNEDETLLNFDPREAVVEAPQPDTAAETVPAGNEDDATLISVALPEGRVAAKPGEASQLRARLDAIAACEAAAQRHLERKEPYLAANGIDCFLMDDANADQAGLEGPLGNLRSLRSGIFDGAWISTGLLISGEEGNLSIHRGANLMLGRDPGDGTPGVKLGCLTISRIPKQLRIDRHDQTFSVADLGSSNGSFLDETPLAANQAAPLDQLEKGMTLFLGGVLDPPEKGDCKIHLSAIGETGSDLFIRVETGHLTETSQAQLRVNWPNMDDDCATRWLFASSPILIGTGADCGLRLDAPDGETPNDAPVARIEWTENGYALSPVIDQITLDGAPVSRPVAIIDGVRLSVWGREFQIKEISG